MTRTAAAGRAAAKAVSRIVIALGVAIVAAATSGCQSADVADPGIAWERLHTRIDSLGSAGHLADAESLVATVRTRPVPAWLGRDLAATAATLRARRSFDAPVQAALRDADAGAVRLPALVARDHLSEAYALARQVVDARAAALDPGNVATSRARLALAQIAFTLGRATETDSIARDVLARVPAVDAAVHPLAGEAEDLIGRVIKNYSGVAYHDAAMLHYQRALEIRERCDGPSSLAVAEVHQDMANVERTLRRTPEARAHFQRALQIERARLGEHSDAVASTWTDLAYMWSTLGDWRETRECMRSAFAAVPDHEVTSTIVRALRLGLLGQALRRTGRVAQSVDVLSEAAAAAETTWSRAPHDAPATVRAGLNIHRELAFALAMQGKSRAAFEQLERGQARLWAPQLPESAWAGVLERVQRALPRDAALVSWSFTTPFPPHGDYPMWACVVRSTGPPAWVRIERVPGWSPRWAPPRELMSHELEFDAEWPIRVTDTSVVDSLARVLGRERFVPIEPLLAGVRRLIVAGPELMFASPLGMLRDAHGERLDERYIITVVPSALAYADLAERAQHATPVAPGSALLVGAPDAGSAEQDRWPPLAGAAEELRGLAQLMPHAQVLTGAQASADRLCRLADDGTLARIDLLHVATHVELTPGRVMQSALVLAPDAPGDARNSRLTAARIADTWHLNARIVDLAGFRSALGFFAPSEGYIGLHNAFLAAGAHSVLVSLWHVDDEATRRLMLDFHARLQAAGASRDPALALQQAQSALREYRAPDGTTPFAHPVYWAGFALVGVGERESEPAALAANRVR